MSVAQLICNWAFGLFICAALLAGIGFIINLPAPAVVEFKHEVVLIDGCEYLQFRQYQSDAITHKGNCKNH